MEEQTLAEMAAEVAKAFKGSGRLKVTGYRSSDGNVKDMEIELMGPSGYNMLVRESLKLLENGDLIAPDTEDGAEAVRQLRDSWRKTLLGEHAPRNYSRELNMENINREGCDVSGGQVVVKDVRCIRSTEIETPKPKKASANPVVRIKNDLKALTPLGSFVGQLNFAPGKVGRVEAV